MSGCCSINVVGVGCSGAIFQTWQLILGFHKSRKICWLSERLSACEEGVDLLHIGRIGDLSLAPILIMVLWQILAMSDFCLLVTCGMT